MDFVDFVEDEMEMKVQGARKLLRVCTEAIWRQIIDSMQTSNTAALQMCFFRLRSIEQVLQVAPAVPVGCHQFVSFLFLFACLFCGLALLFVSLFQVSPFLVPLFGLFLLFFCLSWFQWSVLVSLLFFVV